MYSVKYGNRQDGRQAGPNERLLILRQAWNWGIGAKIDADVEYHDLLLGPALAAGAGFHFELEAVIGVTVHVIAGNDAERSAGGQQDEVGAQVHCQPGGLREKFGSFFEHQRQDRRITGRHVAQEEKSRLLPGASVNGVLSIGRQIEIIGGGVDIDPLSMGA